MKKNLQQKKFLVTLLALCLSMGAKAQGELIDLETYPLDLRAKYPTEMQYDVTAQHKLTFGATGYGIDPSGDKSKHHWVVKLNDPSTFTYTDPEGIEGWDEGLKWTMEFVCDKNNQYNCLGQGWDTNFTPAEHVPFMIVGYKQNSPADYLMFSADVEKPNVFVSDVSITIANDGNIEQNATVELLHNDVPVPGMSETRTLYGMNSTQYKRETFSFDVNQLGVGKCSIRITGIQDIRVYDISYVGTTKQFVEVLTTDYKYASMYYSEFDLITPEKAAYTIEGSGATVESSEAPVPATYVYNAGTGMLEETTTYAPGKIIPRGTAVVVKGTPGCVYRFYVASAESGNPKPHNGSDLKGTDKAELTTGGTYYYALSLNPKNEVNSVGFYWMNWSYIEEDGKSIVVGGKPFINGAHKAYLALDEQPAGHEIKNHFLFNEISSGIENVEQEEGVKTIYNLAGQRLTKMQKGINIVNGKKVLVK